MSSTVLQKWLQNLDQVALRLCPSDQSALPWKRVVVPWGACALVLLPAKALAKAGTSDLHAGFLPSGDRLTGRLETLLVKTGPVSVPCEFPNLISQDGFAFTVLCTLVFGLAQENVSCLEEFSRSLFPTGREFTVSDLRAAVWQDAKNALCDFFRRRRAAELCVPTSSGSTPQEALREWLERALFGRGFVFARLSDLASNSPDYDRHCQDRRHQEERILLHEDALTEQKRRAELFRGVANLLEDRSLHEVLERIPDSRLRSLLYARWVTDNLAHLEPSELPRRLEGWSDELLGKLFETLSNPPLDDPSGRAFLGKQGALPKRGQIWAVSGKSLLKISPDRVEKIEEERKFEVPLRSVRLDREGNETRLLVGWKRGVYVLDPSAESPLSQVEGLRAGGPGDSEPRLYRLPETAVRKGGVNSAALSGPWLYATHSDCGLVRWNLADPDRPAEFLFESLTRGNRTTRAITSAEGVLYFASGSRVYRFDPRGETSEPQPLVPQAPAPVTGLASGNGSLSASCGEHNQGAVCVWSLGDPGRPPELLRERHPVPGVGFCSLGGIPHVLFSGLDHLPFASKGRGFVRAHWVGHELETRFDSPQSAVGLVQGSSDYLVAADPTGWRLMVWETGRPQQPAAQLDLAGRFRHPVYDLVLEPAMMNEE